MMNAMMMLCYDYDEVDDHNNDCDDDYENDNNDDDADKYDDNDDDN